MTSSGLGLQKVMNLFSDNKKVSNDKKVSNNNIKLGDSAVAECINNCNNQCTPSPWKQFVGAFTGGTAQKVICIKECMVRDGC